MIRQFHIADLCSSREIIAPFPMTHWDSVSPCCGDTFCLGKLIPQHPHCLSEQSLCDKSQYQVISNRNQINICTKVHLDNDKKKSKIKIHIKPILLPLLGNTMPVRNLMTGSGSCILRAELQEKGEQISKCASMSVIIHNFNPKE